MEIRAKSTEERLMADRLASELPETQKIQVLEVRYEKNTIGLFAVYVVVQLGKNFTFGLRDKMRPLIRKIVLSSQPTADVFVRFI